MNFQAISPKIKMSCYNCAHFQMREDMLNGYCYLHRKLKSAIGTCSAFMEKNQEKKVKC